MKLSMRKWLAVSYLCFYCTQKSINFYTVMLLGASSNFGLELRSIFSVAQLNAGPIVFSLNISYIVRIRIDGHVQIQHLHVAISVFSIEHYERKY